MTKAACLLLTALVASAAWPQDRPPAADTVAKALTERSAPQPDCKSTNATEVVVCGRSQERYRIDPDVLAASRAAEAAPPKAPLNATTSEQCAGPNCGGGSYVPLVGMALTALKAAELAVQGDDWREAFRTHPDEYKAYENSKAKKGHVSIGLSAGNK